MTRYFVAAATLMFAAPAVAAAQAHTQHGADHSAHHAQAGTVKGFEGEFAAHFKGIELSNETKAKLVTLHDEWHAKMKAVKDEAAKAGKADAPETARKIEDLKTQEHASFRALLTPEQQKQFDLNMKEHHAPESPSKG